MRPSTQDLDMIRAGRDQLVDTIKRTEGGTVAPAGYDLVTLRAMHAELDNALTTHRMKLH